MKPCEPKKVITITISHELIKEILNVQSDKIRKTIKYVSFSEVLEYCIISKKKLHVKDTAHKVRKTITITSKTLKKLRCIQSDNKAKRKPVTISSVIEDHLIS